MIKKECSLTVLQRQKIPPRNLESVKEKIGEKSTVKMKVNSYKRRPISPLYLPQLARNDGRFITSVRCALVRTYRNDQKVANPFGNGNDYLPVAGKERSREKSIEDEGQCLPKEDQVVE